MMMRIDGYGYLCIWYVDYYIDGYYTLCLLLQFINGYCLFIHDRKQINSIFSIDPIGIIRESIG